MSWTRSWEARFGLNFSQAMDVLNAWFRRCPRARRRSRSGSSAIRYSRTTGRAVRRSPPSPETMTSSSAVPPVPAASIRSTVISRSSALWSPLDAEVEECGGRIPRRSCNTCTPPGSWLNPPDPNKADPHAGRQIVLDEVAQRLADLEASFRIGKRRHSAVLQHRHQSDVGLVEIGQHHRHGDVVVEFEVFVAAPTCGCRAASCPGTAPWRPSGLPLVDIVAAADPFLEPLDMARVCSGAVPIRKSG